MESIGLDSFVLQTRNTHLLRHIGLGVQSCRALQTHDIHGAGNGARKSLWPPTCATSRVVRTLVMSEPDKGMSLE